MGMCKQRVKTALRTKPASQVLRFTRHTQLRSSAQIHQQTLYTPVRVNPDRQILKIQYTRDHTLSKTFRKVVSELMTAQRETEHILHSSEVSLVHYR
jgi:hypothetical protein